MYFNEDHQALRSMVRKFVDQDINPHMDQWEKDGGAPLKELFKNMGDLGLLGIRYDEKYGGQNLDYWFECVFLEELGRITGYGLPTAIAVQTNMATPAIAEFGSEYLKETYLKGAVSGDLVAAIGVTEPDAGSDVAALKTTARLEGDHYLINGSKLFITNGCQADFVTLLARTDSKPGYHSFSLLVVPTNLEGFSLGQRLDKVGLHSSDTALLYFDNVRVPRENLIGQEGEGFIYQMRQFQHERFVTMPISCIACREMINMTLDYIRQRIVFGKPLATKQVLRHRIVDWLVEIEALQQLTYHVVRLKMAGQDASKEISMGKLKAGRLIRQVADGCLQMFGGMGFMNETLISRLWRDARLMSIGGGADEVMSEVIARMEGF